MSARRVRKCKSCHVRLDDELPGECRCDSCQATFEAWLRDESPTVYRPRRDGLWEGPTED